MIPYDNTNPVLCDFTVRADQITAWRKGPRMPILGDPVAVGTTIIETGTVFPFAHVVIGDVERWGVVLEEYFKAQDARGATPEQFVRLAL